MRLIWIHEDAMTLDHPVVVAAGDEAKPIFIWDTVRHDHLGYSLKRRMFIYESVLDLDIPIYAGDTYASLMELSAGQPIYAADTPDPYVQDMLRRLRETQEVFVIDAPAFVDIPEGTDTKRFFRFWNQAKASAMMTTEDIQANKTPSKDK